jgi:hypothetical protein
MRFHEAADVLYRTLPPASRAHLNSTKPTLPACRVLVRDPTLRPSIAELLDHPWILKYSRREGGGLARARNRMQQRRPTIDGGMLVRSMTVSYTAGRDGQGRGDSYQATAGEAAVVLVA